MADDELREAATLREQQEIENRYLNVLDAAALLSPGAVRDAEEAGSSKVDDPCTTDRREYRMEALRAASRVVADFTTKEWVQKQDDPAKAFADGTIWLAEQFARWLEKGER